MSSQKKIKKAIVIGGGIAGCSSAYALAKRGILVTLIERNQAIAQEASGNPTAMLYPKLNPSDNALNSMSMQGFSFTLNLLKHLPANNETYNLCGQIQLAFNAREREKQNKLLENANQALPVESLSVAQASEQAGIPLNYGGLYLPQAGWVKPKSFCELLINSNLITCIVSTKAINIQRTSPYWQVLLETKKLLEADIIVICNANDISGFEPCKNIPITSVRGQINFFATNDLSHQIKTVICSDHYLSPVVDGVHSIGTSYAPKDLNPALSNSDTLANINALRKISPLLYHSINLNNLSGRVAWRSATKDYLPLAGQLIDERALRKTPPRYNDNANDLPWFKGLYVNAGHGSKGMITAPICAELIANIVNHEPLIIDKTIASKLNPSRFLLRDMGLKMIAQNLYDF
jgi:tRNA 5-methylaminomethyl-2-thiouridine biosynthesis bifunctional protein